MKQNEQKNLKISLRKSYWDKESRKGKKEIGKVTKEVESYRLIYVDYKQTSSSSYQINAAIKCSNTKLTIKVIRLHWDHI